MRELNNYIKWFMINSLTLGSAIVSLRLLRKRAAERWTGERAYYSWTRGVCRIGLQADGMRRSASWRFWFTAPTPNSPAVARR